MSEVIVLPIHTAFEVRRSARALLAGLVAALAPALTLANAPLSARIEGGGPATIVFASGLGDTLDTWGDVQSRVAANCARTFSYTRAGYTGSPPASGPRDTATVVAELRAELRRRGLRPPYVLVGHSLGGLYMQYFAREFADDVNGLLLVDSTHWNQQLPTHMSHSGYGQRVVLLYMPLIMRRELADSRVAGEQVHASPAARALRTIVLSSTHALRGETPQSRLEAARLQEDIVADFPGARHVRVQGSGHYIHKDRPDVVIDAARELAGCGPAQVPPAQAASPAPAESPARVPS